MRITGLSFSQIKRNATAPKGRKENEMKIQFDGYEVEIKAKYTWQNKANQEVTMALLNTISILYREAAEHRKEQLGSRTAADYYIKPADEIYEVLKDAGYYNN